MSIISLNVEQLKSISSEVATLDNTLVNNYLTDLESELDTIRNNVQGDELHSILNTISSQFASVKTTLGQALPKLEEFLEQQLETYNITEEQLKADLSAVLNKMAAFANDNGDPVAKAVGTVTEAVGVATGAVGAATDALTSTSKTDDNKESKTEDSTTNAETEALKKDIETLKKQNEELTKEINKTGWDKYVEDLGDNFDYSDGNYVTGTVGGVVETVTDSAQGILGDGLLGSVVGGVGDFVNWGITGLDKLI